MAIGAGIRSFAPGIAATTSGSGNHNNASATTGFNEQVADERGRPEKRPNRETSERSHRLANIAAAEATKAPPHRAEEKTKIPAQSRASASPMATTTSSSEDKDNRKILIAEDNEIARLLLKDKVTTAGQPFDMANDGDQALALLKAGNCDKTYKAIATDMDMPFMDGLDFIKEGKKHCKENMPPVFFISASTESFIDGIPNFGKENIMNGIQKAENRTLPTSYTPSKALAEIIEKPSFFSRFLKK